MRNFYRLNSIIILLLLSSSLILAYVSKFNFLLIFFLLFIFTTIIMILTNNKFEIRHYIFSIIFSIIFYLSNRVSFTSVSDSYKQSIVSGISLKSSILFFSFFLVFLVLLKGIDIFVFSNKKNILKIKFFKMPLDNPFIIFIFIFILWTPYLLALYPGCVLPDSLDSINQALGNKPLSNHHPVVFTLFLKVIIKSFSFLGLNKAIFVYTLIQSTIFLSILTYFVCWLKKYNISDYMRLLIIVYFAVAPIFPIYALNIQKDILFAGFLFLFTLKCVDCALTTKVDKWSVFFIVASGVLATFYRNNGVYVVFTVVIIMSIILFKQGKMKHGLSIIAIYFIMTFMIINPLISKYSVPTDAAESLGVPLQQISRVIVLNGTVDHEDKEYLYKLLPRSEYENYTPMLTDSIKWNTKFNNKLLNNNPIRFLKIWAILLPKNLRLYVEAYLLNTYGFWAPFEKNPYGFLDTRVNTNNLKIKQIDLIQYFSSSKIMNQIINRRDFLGSGTLFCLMIVAFYLYWIKKKKSLWIGFIPGFLTWLSIMIATPVAFSLRYVFILAISLPLYFCLPFFNIKKEKL